MKRANTVIAALFLLILALMLALTVLSVPKIGGAIRADWQAREEGSSASWLIKASFAADHAESALNDALDRPHVFIEIYGAVQRITGRRLCADTTPDTSVTRLRNGTLTFCGLGNAYIDPTDNALGTAAFAASMEEAGIPFLAVVAPEKIPAGTKPLPAAVEEFGNEIGDAYLAVLAEQGVASFDLRPAFNGREDYSALFFRTDHHWKPEGAFFACGVLMDELAERYGFAVNEEALAEKNWERTVYEDWFLGSQGKRVGRSYAGLDDFTVYTPRFDTSLRYTIPERELEQRGTFNEALCFPDRVAGRNLYYGNPYTYYSGGDWAKAVMVNENNPGGLRIVLIRDSFSCALAPFLALQCGELTTIDLRYYKGDLTGELTAMEPDAVILLYCTSTTRLENMFSFS